MANMPNTRSAEAARCSRPAQRTIPIMLRSRFLRSSGLILSARRARRTLWVLTAFVAIMVVCCNFASNARAQCPDMTWNGPVTYDTTLASGCELKIIYCWRLVGVNLETWVEEVDAQNDICDGTDPQQWICEASELILSDITLASQLPNCPLTMTGYSSHSQTCWFYHFRPAGGPQYLPCCSSGTCTETATVCWNTTTHTVTVSSHSWASSGTFCSCTTPPTPPIKWIDGTCYTVTCGFCE
jgi:hypothetical protein